MEPKSLTTLPNSRLAGRFLGIISLLLVAAGLRLIVLHHTTMVNPDGMAYILQAKALSLHQYEMVLKAYPWPSNLAFLLLGVYHLVGDWVLAGQLISLFFSLATIVPLFGFCRLFCTRPAAWLLVMFYVASPVFINLSCNIIRGPEFWFFLCLGLWSFCRTLQKENSHPFFLTLTSLAFLMASWSRIEGILPLILSAGWMLCSPKLRRPNYLLAYFAPLLLILLFLGPLFSLESFTPNNNFSEIICRGLSDRLQASWARYNWLRSTLRELQKSPPFGVAPYFFKELRNHLWFLALGVTGHTFIKAFGLAFLPLLLLGRRQQRDVSATFSPRLDRDNRYFLTILILLGSLAIYLQTLLNWASSPRFVSLVFFPLLILAVPGCHRLLQGRRTHLKLVLYSLLLIALALPSTWHKSRTDRSVAFKQIGLEMAKTGLTAGPVKKLGGTSKKILHTHFYAYLGKPEVVLPWQYCTICYIKDLKIDTLIRNDCELVLLSDRDRGRERLLEMTAGRDDIEVAILLEKKNTPLHGRLTLFALQPKKASRQPVTTGQEQRQ